MKKAQFLEKVFTRDGSQQNLWLAKLSFLSCIDDVTHHCQFTASAQLKPQKERHKDVATSTKDIFTPTIKWKDTYSKSIDGCDNRFPHGGDPVPVSQEVPTITFLEGSVLHLLNVSSRCKTRESTHKSIFFNLKTHTHKRSHITKHQSSKTHLFPLTSKGSVAACDDNGSYATVGFKVVQGLAHLLHQPIA